MIWQNPWALLGVVGIVLPVLIHLLGRGHARVLRFPTLRFIDASRLLPTKRSRIQDPLLLAVRVAIVALAAIALAQPLLLTNDRQATLDRGLARAVIADTSASVARGLLDSARAAAAALAADAQTSVVVQTNDPAAQLRGAIAWVAKQQRRGEIAIVSDFQRGQLERSDLAVVPASIGIVLRRSGIVATTDSAVGRVLVSGRTIAANASSSVTGVDAEWRAAAASSIPRPAVALFAAPVDKDALAALEMAAATASIPLPIDTTRAIAVLFNRYPAIATIKAALRPAKVGWQLRLLDNARRAALPIVSAGNADVEGRSRFVVLTDAEPTSVEAVRLVNLARQATSRATLPSEHEPNALSDSELRALERAPTESPSAQHRPLDDNGPSDARWLWVLVLALLAVEWRLRRVKTVATATVEERARAA